MIISARTYMRGDKRAERKINKITTGIETRVGMRTINEIAKRTQISMKLRAPRDTGDLRRSISIRVVGPKRMELMIGTGLERPYDVYQDYGYAPHRVPVEKLKPTSVKLQGIISRGKPKVITVRRFKPFIEPTIEEYLRPNVHRIVNDVWKAFLREIG